MELPKKFPRKMSASWTLFCGIILVKVTFENSSGLGLIKRSNFSGLLATSAAAHLHVRMTEID
jgi:hypothetical protein